ncbi:MAG: transcription-repair coupling factor, partial [Pseudomonadota bacterium]
MPTKTNPSPAISPFSPPLPGAPGNSVIWKNLYGCGDSLTLAAAGANENRLFVIVTKDNHTALRLEHELEFFLPEEMPVLHFPDWETLPYDVFSPLPEIVSQRLDTLSRLPQTKRGILVVSVGTLLQKIAPREHIIANTLSLAIGERFNLEESRQRLESVGYYCASQVYQHGEFAVRGSIIDIFPMGSAVPYRIELFDDEIESIRTFDPENQRSLEKVSEVRLFPAREFPFTEESIKTFRRAFRTHFPNATQHNRIYQEASKGIAFGGIEYYLPLFVEKTETLFDYLPAHATLVLYDSVLSSAESYTSEIENRHEQRRHDIERPILDPEDLYLSLSELNNRIARFRMIEIQAPDASADVGDTRSFSFAINPLPDVAFQPRLSKPAEALESFLADFPEKTLFVAETAGHREALLETLRSHNIRPKTIETWREFLSSETSPCILVAPMDHGLWIENPPLAVITETQLTGEKAQQRRRRRRSATRDLDNIVGNLNELSIGDPVVHQDHGVGRYLGLQMLRIGDVKAEFLTLEYANNDKLYVPISSLQSIGRYSGASPETAPLHKLGSEQWSKAKRKAFERVRDVAAELLEIHAKRAVKKGHAFDINHDEYQAFAAAFPFEETPDQETAIRQVMEDMASEQPMDRVICGDVGFGKTEVSMRAAFFAVQNGKQVAVLVPTTLLAQQHYQNFRDRFADWPVRIEVLSRFVTKKHQDAILQELADGKVDIVIGTHKLLQENVRYKRLDLIVIDEEHRFGVRQKEYFKKLRAELDMLTLTATPIPRTLNMAMSGLRDISIIASPPPNRHAIKTFTSEWVDALIQEACQREIRRGGQIFFLHNSIKTIDKIARELEHLVPDAQIGIAHGRMSERELERIMLEFYHQRLNLLLCTTIIESGIDIPSANTIIIDRADKLGLAQLHQLRGRVGRSHHRAYAYLLMPPKTLMTRDAVKRLQAIEATADLGAGFMLASHDLEIRGAGELLGEEQSGQIHAIGFTLYTELLERAVTALKSGKQPELEAPETGPEVDLQCPALIPEDYLPDVHARLVLYKRIASAQNAEELYDLQVEMIDRFGLLPEATKTLFSSAELKQAADHLGIRKIECGASGGRIIFMP